MHKIQEMLRIEENLTGTFARKTSLRTENARDSYIDGSNEKPQN